MESSLTAISDVILRPLVAAPLVWTLAALGLAMVALGLARGLKGAALRFLSLSALILALLNPALVREDREALADVVALVVDDSASQSREDRRELTVIAAEAIEERVAALVAASGGRAPIELRRIDASGDALIGPGGVGEPVADDDSAPLERRPDRASQVLVARSGEQQGLGQRRPAVGGTGDQEVADLLGARRAAGLAGQQHLAAVRGEAVAQQAGLRALARPLPAFKGDEESRPAHAADPTAPSPRRLRFCASAGIRARAAAGPGSSPKSASARPAKTADRGQNSSNRPVTREPRASKALRARPPSATLSAA